MGVGEGGGELAKQLLKNTYDIDPPQVVLVWVTGEVPHGIGPHDVAIALVGATFPGGFVKNKVLEFAGPGIAALSTDFRIGVDVMTTETSCLTSIWATDEKVQAYYESLGRPEAYKKLAAPDGAYYDAMVEIDLSRMESMIALPFHPSKAYTNHELQADPDRIFTEIEAECNRELGGKVELDLHRSIDEKGASSASRASSWAVRRHVRKHRREAAAIMDGRSGGRRVFRPSPSIPPPPPSALRSCAKGCWRS
jgi:aconitate hydratase